MEDIRVIPNCHDGGMVSLIQSHALLLVIFASLNLKASIGMYSRCDFPLQILFVYFLILPSLLHPSIVFILVPVLFLLHIIVHFINAILHGLLTTSVQCN